jgi:hypothetical protein
VAVLVVVYRGTTHTNVVVVVVVAVVSTGLRHIWLLRVSAYYTLLL